MKKIFLLTGILAFMLGSCIEDKGSYDYVSVERPEIVLNDQYRAPKIDEETRENLVVRPVVEYSDLSKLTWVYEFTNPANPDSLVVYEGAADGSLDSQIEELPNGQYSVNLTVTVTDDSGIAVGDDPGMKYFYRFEAFLGTTPYMEGVMVLANDGGASKLHFIDIYDVLYEDVYAAENNGAAIPGTPVQMIYPKSFMGSNISYAYMILTDNGGIADGVIIDPVELKKLRTMAENFEPAVTMGAPGMMSMAYNHPFPAQPWGSVVITMGGKAYYSMPFGANPADQKSITFIGDTPVLGSAMPGASMTYEFTDFAPNKNNIGSPALFWAYDANAKALRLFMAGMMSVPGQSLQMVMIVDPMAPWNSLNLGISNPITLQAHSGGCWFLGEEAGQIVGHFRVPL